MSKVCFISGSSRGIGLAIAEYLAKEGHTVILNSRKPIEDEVLSRFDEMAEPVGQVIGDISDFDEAQRMMQEILDEYGRLDVLVNNAGITRDGLAMRMKEEDFDAVIETNLKGPFNLIRHAIKAMVKQRTGTIINISSVSGLMGNPGQLNYSAAKAGLIGMTKSLAREVGSRGITVNAIAPGFIESDMTDALADKYHDQIKKQIPAGRFGKPEEIAQTVQFLIENRYITGQTIQVDGGLGM
ncbi:3-oxoacyl-[acyl-carrier-protein] reductase [Aerococcaceae bacterium DSM 111020]|nr:3-oxoacyl-[acyl-carrier-protein] reductase [Aerococcaceae bacterium DSM 111020]